MRANIKNMDKAQKYTDEQLKQMEKHLTGIYKEAQSDISKKWDEYMESVKPKLDALQTAYDEAKKSGDKDLITKAGKELGKATREQTITNKYYKDMLDQTTTQLANVNKTALAYINDQLPEIYSINYNQIKLDLPEFGGYSFDLVDANTVKNLATTDKSLLPTKALNVAKDKKWNTKVLNSQVLQGILQGESVDKIAGRLKNVTDMNYHSAVRNARTMTTGAQNKGRMDSYKKAQTDGIIMKKVWLATPGDRTRAWHGDLNNVEAEVDEPFENEYGKIMFPGDPTAHPANVYNCRCTLKTKIIGFKK